MCPHLRYPWSAFLWQTESEHNSYSWISFICILWSYVFSNGNYCLLNTSWWFAWNLIQSFLKPIQRNAEESVCFLLLLILIWRWNLRQYRKWEINVNYLQHHYKRAFIKCLHIWRSLYAGSAESSRLKCLLLWVYCCWHSKGWNADALQMPSYQMSVCSLVNSITSLMVTFYWMADWWHRPQLCHRLRMQHKHTKRAKRNPDALCVS